MIRKIIFFLLITGLFFADCLSVQAESQQEQKSELTIVVPENRPNTNEKRTSLSKEMPTSKQIKVAKARSRQNLLATNEKSQVCLTVFGCLCLAVAGMLYYAKRKKMKTRI